MSSGVPARNCLILNSLLLSIAVLMPAVATAQQCGGNVGGVMTRNNPGMTYTRCQGTTYMFQNFAFSPYETMCTYMTVQNVAPDGTGGGMGCQLVTSNGMFAGLFAGHCGNQADPPICAVQCGTTGNRCDVELSGAATGLPVELLEFSTDSDAESADE